MDRIQRRQICQENMRILSEGGYQNSAGNFIEVPDMKLHGQRFCECDGYPHVVYPDELTITVVNQDSFTAAGNLTKEGLHPAVLNMASAHVPGGGYFSGAGAQEESLCRRSNLVTSLYGFTRCENLVDEYNQDPIRFQKYGYQDSLKCDDVIYSNRILVYRNDEQHNYALLDKPFEVSVLTAAAPNHPKLDRNERIVANIRTKVKNHMRILFRIAMTHGNDSLVLGAWGCGVFGCPPEEISGLFKEVLQESEFKRSFQKVVFAVMAGTASNGCVNGNNNFRTFQEVFNQQECSGTNMKSDVRPEVP